MRSRCSCLPGTCVKSRMEAGIGITSSWEPFFSSSWLSCRDSVISSGAVGFLISGREIRSGQRWFGRLTEETLLNDLIFLKLEDFVFWVWRKL